MIPPTRLKEIDDVKNPQHYNEKVPGVECWDVAKHFDFLEGSALKYIWRSDFKGTKKKDLQKAIQFLQKKVGQLNEQDDE